MEKICKEYLRDVKSFFPIIGKKEKQYLNSLVPELEDCIEEEKITTKQQLYTSYGQPYNVVQDYYDICDTRDIIRKINLSKYLKACIFVIIAAGLIIGFTYLFSALHRINIESRENLIGTDSTNQTTVTIIDHTIPSEQTDSKSKDDEIIEDEIIEDEIIEDEIIEDEIIE